MNDADRARRSVTFPPASLGIKFKHAAAFGVTGAYSRAGAAAFEEALRRHVEAPTTRIIRGTFRGSMPVILFVEPSTGLMVMTHPNGIFISGWRLSDEQLPHVWDRGRL